MTVYSASKVTGVAGCPSVGDAQAEAGYGAASN